MALTGTALIAAAMNVAAALETAHGVPVAVVSVSDGHPETFWTRASEILCRKTSRSICSPESLQHMTYSTNPLGQSRVLTYVDGSGQQKKVCLVIPPRRDVSSGFAARGLTRNKSLGIEELPDNSETEAWLLMNHAARCADKDGSQFEEKRADAFATLALTLLQGDPAFVGGTYASPSRTFSWMRNENSSAWASSLGERILLDLWKNETAAKARKTLGCNVRNVKSGELNTQAIKRESSLAPGDSCAAGEGVVTDGNLALWMNGTNASATGPKFSGFGAPPEPWQPLKMFDNTNKAVAYMWQSADSIARQR